MARAPVFWFDFNSPFVYLAAERIDGLIPDAEWRPFAYPILLGQVGRLEEAMARDPEVARAAVTPRVAELGLPPFNPPAGWPQATWSLAPLRAAVFADELGRLEEFTRAALRTFFADGLPLTDDDNLGAAAAAAGLDPGEVLRAVGRPDLKDRVRENTEAALARGVNGIPTFEIGDQLVWGDDRLHEAAAAARG